MIEIVHDKYTVTIKGNQDELLKTLDKLLERDPPMIRFEVGFTPYPNIMVGKEWYNKNFTFAEELDML
jgi:hypothetical protein